MQQPCRLKINHYDLAGTHLTGSLQAEQSNRARTKDEEIIQHLTACTDTAKGSANEINETSSIPAGTQNTFSEGTASDFLRSMIN